MYTWILHYIYTFPGESIERRRLSGYRTFIYEDFTNTQGIPVQWCGRYI